MVRFIHTSDWQLGMTRHYLPPEAQARFTADRIDAVRRIGELARRLGAEFVVVAGDVFEHSNLPDAHLARAAGALGEMGVPVYLLPGNHDHLGPGSVWSRDAFTKGLPGSVYILNVPGIHRVSESIELVAAPWTGKHPEADPVAGALGGLAPGGTIRILVGHGMLGGVTFTDDSDGSVVRPEPLHQALNAGVIHYAALGDRHIMWPPDNSGRIHYPGAHESTSFREKGPGKVLEVELDDETLTVTPHVVGRWEHVLVDADLESDADLNALDAQLSAMSDRERTIVKHVLRGSLDMAQSARLDEILDRHKEVFASLTARARHSDLVVIPGGDDFAGLPVGGFAKTAADELAARAAAGDDTAVGALKLMYRLAGGVR